MPEAALLIAMLLHRPVGLVSTVYDMAGLSGVCVVEYESQFNEKAWRREARGGTSWGLWQLWSECHPQYRDDLLMHLVYGAEFWKACLEKANMSGVVRGTSIRQTTAELDDQVIGRPHEGCGNGERHHSFSIARAYSIWNSGSPWRSIEKGKAVERKYNSLAMYLYRRMR